MDAAIGLMVVGLWFLLGINVGAAWEQNKWQKIVDNMKRLDHRWLGYPKSREEIVRLKEEA